MELIASTVGCPSAILSRSDEAGGLVARRPPCEPTGTAQSRSDRTQEVEDSILLALVASPKLNAGGRDEAVARASELGLI
jgi:hypothetical protein